MSDLSLLVTPLRPGLRAEGPAVPNFRVSWKDASGEERAYRAALEGDRVGLHAALDALKALGKDDAWTRDRTRELENLAGDADPGRLTKELFMGTSESAGSHTRDLDAEERTFLQRKKRKGKGDPGKP